MFFTFREKDRGRKDRGKDRERERDRDRKGGDKRKSYFEKPAEEVGKVNP